MFALTSESLDWFYLVPLPLNVAIKLVILPIYPNYSREQGKKYQKGNKHTF